MQKLTVKRRNNRPQDQHVAESRSIIDTTTASSRPLFKSHHHVLNSSEDLTTALSSKPESFNMNCFNADELECLEKLSAVNRCVSNELVIRYAVYYKFNYTKAKEAISKAHTKRCLYLEMEGELMRYFMQSMVCFPLPELKSRKTGSDVFYFRPSRYFPTSRNMHLLLDSFCYIFNDLSRNTDQCRNGIVMLVNMDGYSMKNFHNDTHLKMTRLTEGDVIPTRIVDILLVNPPKGFTRLWKVMRPAFSSASKRRIHIIKNEKLGHYLMDGYQEYLPDEFMGWRITEEMVVDWVDQKRYEEQEEGQSCML